MPPLCSEKRCPQNIGRRSKVSSRITRPTLLIGGGMEDKGDDAEESDENISPDAEKSEIRFTLERKRDKDGEDKNNNRKHNNDGNERGRNRSKGDGNHGRRKGRGGNSNGTSRSRGGGDRDHRPPFHENDDGENGDGGRGHDRGSGSGRGGDDNDEGDNGNKGGRGGRGGGGSENDRGGSDSDPDDNSSTPLPLPPPPPPTSTTSSVIETSTTMPVVISTSMSAPEAMISSILQDSPGTTFTQLPALGEPSPIMTLNPIVPTTDPDRAVGDTQTSTSFTTTGVADPSVPAPTQTQTSPANSRGNAKGHHRGDNGNDNSNGNNNNRGHRGELNRTSERILVATGSIGGFIVFCFIVWIIYRTVKKSKQSSHRGDSNYWLSRLIPWRGRPATSNARALTGSYESKEPLPAYDAGNNNSMEAFGYYDHMKLRSLDSENMAYPSAAVRQAPEVQPLPPGTSPNQYPQLGDRMIGGGDSNSTLQSRVPDPYYDQSEVTRQPSDVYNPAPRQVDRASEISSLSSGFGDGDIIIPPPNVMTPKTPTTRPFSWMRQRGIEQQRDTVYTTTSERRFRSVNSWVDLQKKRMKRAG